MLLNQKKFTMLRRFTWVMMICATRIAFAAEPLVLQAVRSGQPYMTTGAGLTYHGDFLVVGEGPEGTGAILLKVTGAAFAGQTDLSLPTDFGFFGGTAAVVADGFVFSGITSTGDPVLFETDVSGAHVTHVAHPKLTSVSIFDTDGELWITGQTQDNRAAIGRLDGMLEANDLTLLPQAKGSRATQVTKYQGSYYVLTSGAPSEDQTVLWKLSAERKVVLKKQIAGPGAEIAITDRGLAVSYGKDAVPYVDFLGFDLAPKRSTRLFIPRAGGAVRTIIAVKDRVYVVGGDRDRLFVATLSTDGALLDLAYDDKNALPPSMPGYAVNVVTDGLWIVGSFVEAAKTAKTDSTISLFTLRDAGARSSSTQPSADVRN